MHQAQAARDERRRKTSKVAGVQTPRHVLEHADADDPIERFPALLKSARRISTRLPTPARSAFTRARDRVRPAIRDPDA